MYTQTLPDPITNEVSRPGHLGCLTGEDSRVFLSSAFSSMGFIHLRSYWAHSSSTCGFMVGVSLGNMRQLLWLTSDREEEGQGFNENNLNNLQRLLLKESWKIVYHSCVFKLTLKNCDMFSSCYRCNFGIW